MAKKKVVQTKTTISPTLSKSRASSKKVSDEPLLFGKQNYILMLAGVLVMMLGFLLMLGGEMPDPNTWDEDLIYGFRRTVLAPFMILAGLVTLVFAIFKKQSAVDKNAATDKETTITKQRVVNKNM